MQIKFDQSFSDDLRSVKNKAVLKKVGNIIHQKESINRLSEIKNLGAIKGRKGYFRIRAGSYRIGLRFSEQTIIFERILLRKDIYNFFPS